MTRRWVFELAWGNPYTEPPNGQPRVLMRIEREVESTREVPQEILEAWRPGNGYAVRLYPADLETQPRRQRKPEVKGRIRLKRLQRAAQRKAPLFADQIVERELAKRPKYFSGEEKE